MFRRVLIFGVGILSPTRGAKRRSDARSKSTLQRSTRGAKRCSNSFRLDQAERGLVLLNIKRNIVDRYFYQITVMYRLSAPLTYVIIAKRCTFKQLTTQGNEEQKKSNVRKATKGTTASTHLAGSQLLHLPVGADGSDAPPLRHQLAVTCSAYVELIATGSED